MEGADELSLVGSTGPLGDGAWSCPVLDEAAHALAFGCLVRSCPPDLGVPDRRARAVSTGRPPDAHRRVERGGHGFRRRAREVERETRANDYAGGRRSRFWHLGDLVRWRSVLRACSYPSHAKCPRGVARQRTQVRSFRCRGRRPVHDRPARESVHAWLFEIDETSHKNAATCGLTVTLAGEPSGPTHLVARSLLARADQVIE